MSTDKREFVVTLRGNFKGRIFIDQETTLEDVRNLIVDEFDDIWLPSGEWQFLVGGIVIMPKQEKRQNAWEILDKGSEVRILLLESLPNQHDDNESASNGKRQKREHPTVAAVANSSGIPAKISPASWS